MGALGGVLLSPRAAALGFVLLSCAGAPKANPHGASGRGSPPAKPGKPWSAMTLRELELVAAEPLARHGYAFDVRWLHEHFTRQSWYQPVGFDPTRLPPAERATVDAAQRFEETLSYAELERRAAELERRGKEARASCPSELAVGGTGTDARALVTTPGGERLLVDLASARQRAVPSSGHGGAEFLPSATLSSDGKRVFVVEPAGFDGKVVASFDAATLEHSPTPLPELDSGESFLIARGGRFALHYHYLGSPENWRLYSLVDGRKLAELGPPPFWTLPLEVSVSRDGLTVGVLADGHGVLWWRLPAPGSAPAAVIAPAVIAYDSSPPRAFDLAPDGSRVALTHWQHDVRVTDLQGKDAATLAEKLKPVGWARFAPNGHLVLGSGAGGIGVWDTTSGRLVFSRSASEGPDACVEKAAFSADSRQVLVAGIGGGLRRVLLSSGEESVVHPATKAWDAEESGIEAELLAKALGKQTTPRFLASVGSDELPALLEQPLRDQGSWVELNDIRRRRATIYARRGRVFASPYWNGFAHERPWYRPDPTYTDARLRPIDRENLEHLRQLEAADYPRPTVRTDPSVNVAKTAFPACPTGTTLERRSDDESVEWLSCIAHDRAPNGPRWSFYPTGRLASRQSYVDRKEHGHSLTWGWNGVRSSDHEFVRGERQGVSLDYYPGGALREQAHYAADQLEGSRRRFFENGRLALDASYRAGSPEGEWTTYYDNGERALNVTYRSGRELGAARRFSLDGKPWPQERRIEACTSYCVSPLEYVDVESLPAVADEPCRTGITPASLAWPNPALRPLVEAARRTWKDEPFYPPGDCMARVDLKCGPNLDGAPGAEVLATLRYGIPFGEEATCDLDDPNRTWRVDATVVLTPPRGGRSWQAHGRFGYAVNNTDLGDERTRLRRFVRLPDGQVAAHLAIESSSSDCGHRLVEEIQVLEDDRWRAATQRVIDACGRGVPPEALDVY